PRRGIVVSKSSGRLVSGADGIRPTGVGLPIDTRRSPVCRKSRPGERRREIPRKLAAIRAERFAREGGALLPGFQTFALHDLELLGGQSARAGDPGGDTCGQQLSGSVRGAWN